MKKFVQGNTIFDLSGVKILKVVESKTFQDTFENSAKITFFLETNPPTKLTVLRSEIILSWNKEKE